MFSRIAWEDWQILFPIIAFTLIFLGFLFFVLRAVFMKGKKADRMSRLPLEEEEKQQPSRQRENGKAGKNNPNPPA
ncbi:MAG: hypothetical protein JJT75_06350 [Opitutales bacterium]|nr:hypothetical protein [Opitutales bacterium]MCH8541277.1 hypothetical protein [Opitutales bacterium]